MHPGYHIRIWAIVAVSLGLSAIRASDFSVQPTGVLTLEGWSLFDGGVDSGESSLGLLHLGSDFSLGDKTHGHVGAFLFSGDNDVDSFTGDFGVYSNIITDSRYILFTAWLQSDFQDSSFRWGQLAVDEAFFVSETASLFINDNFGAIPTVSANISAPVFRLVPPELNIGITGTTAIFRLVLTQEIRDPATKTIMDSIGKLAGKQGISLF